MNKRTSLVWNDSKSVLKHGEESIYHGDDVPADLSSERLQKLMERGKIVALDERRGSKKASEQSKKDQSDDDSGQEKGDQSEGESDKDKDLSKLKKDDLKGLLLEYGFSEEDLKDKTKDDLLALLSDDEGDE